MKHPRLSAGRIALLILSFLVCDGARADTPFAPGPTMLEPRAAHSATVLQNGLVLMAGGVSANNGFTRSAELYDPASRRVVETGSMTQARAAHSAVLLPDGRVLVTGGSDLVGPLDTAEIFDPRTGTFTAVEGHLSLRRYQHVSVVSAGGSALIIGGGTGDYGDQTVAGIERFDPLRGSFSVVGYLREGRFNPRAALLTSGHVVIAGGFAKKYPPVLSTGNVEVFEPATGVSRSIDQSNRPFVGVFANTDGSAYLVDNGLSRLSADEESIDSLSVLPPMVGNQPFPIAAERASDGRILVFFGNSDDRTGVARLSPTQAVPLGDLTFNRSGFTVSALSDGGVIVTGGTGTGGGFVSQSELSNTSRFRLVSSLAPLTPSALLITDPADPSKRKLLVTGGSGPGGPSRAAELVDPETGASTPLPSMQSARTGHFSIEMRDGRVLIVGGNAEGQLSTEVFDGDRFVRSAQTQMQVTAGTTLLDGRVLLTGSSFADPGHAEIYDPVTDSFSTSRPPGNVSGIPTQTLLMDGTVLLLYDEAAALLFDPRSNSFTEVQGPESTSYSDFSAVRLANGQVLISGGRKSSPYVRNEATADARIYDPSTRSFHRVGQMFLARQNHTSTLLPDGTVLIAGGADGSPYRLTLREMPAAEIFDPATETFTPIGGLTLGRYRHSAALNEKGEVLIFGGVKSTETFLESGAVHGTGPVLQMELFSQNYRRRLIRR